MPKSRHYPHAPITEALVDLRVNYGPEVSLESLRAFGAHIKASYPHEGTRDMLQSEITVVAGQPKTESKHTTLGYIFHSEDRRQAVQARIDGFTFSRFAPYQDWTHLIGEAKRLWTIFVDALRPKTVSRIAVRYINQVNLPLKDGTLRFEDYLRTLPVSGSDEEIALEQFFLRLVMPQQDLSAKLILTEALLPREGDYLGVILDIDLFRENTSLDSRSAEIWDILETFRERKNRYFEASLTDTTRVLFT